MKKYIFSLLVITALVLPSVSLAENSGSSLTVLDNGGIPLGAGAPQVQAPYNSNTGTYSAGGQTLTVNPTTGTITPAPFSGGGKGCTTPKDFATLFEYVICIITYYITPFLIGLGVIIFLAGVVGYVRAGDDVEKRAAGRDLMWFGIVALFVMVSVWGFVGILTRSFFGREAGFESLPRRATSVFAP